MKTYFQTTDDDVVDAVKLCNAEQATRATLVGGGVTVQIPQVYEDGAPGWSVPASVEVHPDDHDKPPGAKRRLVTIDPGVAAEFDDRIKRVRGRDVIIPRSNAQKPPGYDPADPPGRTDPQPGKKDQR